MLDWLEVAPEAAPGAGLAGSGSVGVEASSACASHFCAAVIGPKFSSAVGSVDARKAPLSPHTVWRMKFRSSTEAAELAENVEILESVRHP